MSQTKITGVGVGLRAEHYDALLASLPDIAWLEIHSENYFGGGRPLHYLERLRAHYALSLHGVGLSLGGCDPLDRLHLMRLMRLIARIEPFLVSEHLSWGALDGVHFNDLLPLPYTEEALQHFAERVSMTQEILGRAILVENPSSYLQFRHSTLREWEFLNEVARITGCGLLLDINNVYVSAVNHGFDPHHYLSQIDPKYVREIHLAGHTQKRFDGEVFLIDTHDQPVSEAVWALYKHSLGRFSEVPTLIERDSNIPPLHELIGEALQARTIQGRGHANAA